MPMAITAAPTATKHHNEHPCWRWFHQDFLLILHSPPSDKINAFSAKIKSMEAEWERRHTEEQRLCDIIDEQQGGYDRERGRRRQ